MKTFGRSLIAALALAAATASLSSTASAYGHGGGHSGYSCKRYCSSWGWSGWGHNKHKVCKVWSCH